MINERTLHRRAARVLPEVLQTSGVLLPDAGQAQLAALLFPLRRKSEGSLAFRISRQTLEILSKDPAECLSQATCARESISRHSKRFAYEPWRRVMVPLEGTDVNRAGASHAEHMEVYFTIKSDGKALLMLIPEERLLIYVWDG